MNMILGQKQNMTRIFDEDGIAIAVTVVKVEGNKIVGKKSQEKDGYNASIVGYGKKLKPTKAEIGKYKKVGYVPLYVNEVKEVYADKEVGEDITASIFVSGDKVDVTGITKGKGFQGVVKRWGFKGGPKTHGQSNKHRSPGSIGSGSTPGRVYKGKKMGGRMGNITMTVKNLKVINNLIVIKGALPGPRGSFVIIKSKQHES